MCREVASGKGVCQASEFASDMPRCERYAARQTVCYMDRHDMIKLGFTTVERTEPKDLPTLVSVPSSHNTGDFNSRLSDLELGALTKWLASRMLD
jgi:hypothetical protein